MSFHEQDTAISYYIEEIESDEKSENFDIDYLLSKIELDDNICSHMINYRENYTIKELLLICQYYGFAKTIKSAKMNKEQIIDFLVNFESDKNNVDIVCKRQNLWFYMNELKSDKFMRKYIIW
jgi:hypothetical protein